MKTAELGGGKEAVFGCHVHAGTSVLDQEHHIYCSIISFQKQENERIISDLDFLYILNMFLLFS